MNDPRVAASLADDAADLSFSELEMDSLAAMEFCIEIEERSGVEIDPADLIRYPSVVALASMLSARS